MGFFDIFKSKNESKKAAEPQPTMSEFNEDVKNLLGRDDIQCRKDICEVEYNKAQDLLKNPTKETIHRAYDIMGNLASQFDYVPAILWMGDFVENAMGDLPQATRWYKKAAELGSGEGARNYADMLMTGRGTKQDSKEAMRYYTIAADKGVPEAAFVVGELMRNQGNRTGALKAYKQALEGGYEPAQIRINQMNNGSI